MTESEIKKLICQWLAANRALFWLHIAQRMNKRSKYLPNGIADIIGIWKGRPLAIEVKTPKGIVSDEQKEFLQTFNERGGIGFVARNLDDVIRKLEAA